MNNNFKNELEVSDEQLSLILSRALSKGGTYADIYYEYKTTNNFTIEEGILKNASLRVVKGCGVRVLSGEQTGYAYTENLTLASLLKAAETAAEIAKKSGKERIIRLSESPFNNICRIDRPFDKVLIKDKIELMKKAENAASEYDSLISKVSISYMDEVKNVMIADSNGLLLRDVQPMFMFYVTVIAEKYNNKQRGLSSVGGRLGMEYFSKIMSPEEHGKAASKQAITMLDAIDSPAGPMEVILSAGDSGILLHEAIGHPLEADFNRKGTSAYSGRMGEKVASPLCTVIDSGIIPNDRGSINFDDEGVIAKENILIEDGILKQYMSDRISAGYFKTAPTGNGRRESFKNIPLPRMTTTYMLNGNSSYEEIIRSTKKGICCKTFSGGQVDISNGDFVFVPSEAYLIENGSIKAPIKNLTLIGNGPDVLTRVSMVGNDLKISGGSWTCGKDSQSVPVGVGLPTVKISEMTVGGSDIG
jgi:TldD protein